MTLNLSRFARRAGLVGLVGFAAHACYALLAAPEILPLSDATAYRLLAKHLAEGRGYIRPYDFAIDGIIRPTAEFPPGFPVFLSLFERLGIDSIAGQRLVLSVVGGVTAMLVAYVARRWLSDRGALAVGLVAAVHPALVQSTATLLSESIFICAMVGVLLGAVRLRECPSVGRGIALGLVGGVGALTRSEGLLVAVLVGAIALLGAAPPRRTSGAAFAAALLVLPGAWAVRNLAVFDDPVLVSNNLGSVLAGANCDVTYHGDLLGFWLISDDCFPGFTRETLAFADESVLARQARADGLDYLTEHLDRLPVVATVRVLRVFQLWEPEQQAHLATFEGRRRTAERVTGWITWGTLPLAAIGMASLARRGDWTGLGLLTAPIVVVVVVAAATYGNARMRIAAEVPLLLLAAIAVTSVARAMQAPGDPPSRDQPHRLHDDVA